MIRDDDSTASTKQRFATITRRCNAAAVRRIRMMNTIDWVHNSNGLDEQAVREELKDNLCRYASYHNIVKAVLALQDGI